MSASSKSQSKFQKSNPIQPSINFQKSTPIKLEISFKNPYTLLMKPNLAVLKLQYNHWTERIKDPAAPRLAILDELFRLSLEIIAHEENVDFSKVFTAFERVFTHD